MNDFKIFKSNKLEILLSKLTESISHGRSSFSQKENILLHSTGMSKWLSLNIAEKNGICMNHEFFFPNTLIGKLQSFSDQETDKQLIDINTLQWIISRILSDKSLYVKNKNFASIINYINLQQDTAKVNPDNDLKIFQLSAKIADIFDQYTIYREEMIRQWDTGKPVCLVSDKFVPLEKDLLWQYDLWKMIFSNNNYFHRANQKSDIIDIMKNNKKLIISQLNRLSIFGISTLPFYHLDIVTALSEIIPVKMFLFSPTKEFWEDIVSEKLKSKIAVKKNDTYYEVGNDLLASLGKLGKDFGKIILSDKWSGRIDSSEEFYEDYYSSDSKSLLSWIQSDILNLTNSSANKNSTKISIAENDMSITIHSCHGPMREMEVLYDYLIKIINEHGIQPSEILVMTPDIEKYSPYIKSVFNSFDNPSLKIPFAISDIIQKSTSEIFEYFLKVLSIAKGRFYYSEIIDLLECGSISGKFNISEEDRLVIADIIYSSGVRWGKNSEDREAITKIPFNENSWEFGIDRILLSYAQESCDRYIYSDTIAFNQLSTEAYCSFGRFLDLFKIVSDFSNDIKCSRTISAWTEIINSVMDNLFLSDSGNFEDIQSVKNLLHDINNERNKIDNREISYNVIEYYIEKYLTETRNSYGFLTGKTTFCEILPMRNIPFKVIALLGMNNGDFPRVQKSPGFSLIGKHPIVGDRSVKDDDRYIFLESLLSARQFLYISYIGKKVKDNSELAPAVPVKELMNYISKGFTPENSSTDGIMDIVFYEHKINSYETIYLTSEKYFTYSRINLLCAQKAYENSTQEKLFFSKNFSIPVKTNKVNITLNDLKKFFHNPSKFIMTNLLNINYYNNDYSLVEDEFFDLDFSIKCSIIDKLTAAFIQNDDMKSMKNIKNIFKLKGKLPPLKYGEYKYDKLENLIIPLLEKVKTKIDLSKISNFHLKTDYEINGIITSVSGSISGISENGIFLIRDSIWDKDFIDMWLDHLFLCISDIDDTKKQTWFFSTTTSMRFNKIDADAAGVYLKDIIKIYIKGFNSPVRFFFKSGKEYIEKLKNSSSEKALNSTRSYFTNSFNGRKCEFNDLYVNRIYKYYSTSEILDDEFISLSEIIWKPILDNLTEIKHD